MTLPTLLALLLSYIATCLWLHRARRNATALRPESAHARAIGWVWFGWLVPVVSLWFPYQIVRDVLRALGPRKGSRAALGVWWTAFLTYLVYTDITARLDLTSSLSDETDARVFAATEAVSAMLCVSALVPWLLIIAAVRSDQKTAATTERDSNGLAGQTRPSRQDVWSPPSAPAYPQPPSARPFGTAPELAPENPVSNQAVVSWEGRPPSGGLPGPLPPAGYGFGDRRTRVRPVVGLGWVIAGATVFAIAVAAMVSLARLQLSEDGLGDLSGDDLVDVSALTVGDCVRDMSAGSEDASLDAVEVIACSKPHAEEVYGKFSLPDEKYPGDDRMETLAWRGCDKRFVSYVGLPVASNRVDNYVAYPVSETWAEGDRVVVCTVAARKVPSKGSLRNFGR